MSSSFGSEHKYGSRQLRCWPKWSMPQEMLQQSDSPSKIIIGCSETRAHERSSFTSHVIHLVCVFLHLTWCFFVFALLLKYQWEKQCEGLMEPEIQAFHYDRTWPNADTDLTGSQLLMWNRQETPNAPETFKFKERWSLVRVVPLCFFFFFK